MPQFAWLPASISARVDWAGLTRVPIGFVDEELAERQADLLFETRIGERPALIYFLFEHQSSVDGWMPLRLLDYSVRAWNDWRRNHPQEKQLPAIIPVVLHHSETGWTTSTRFMDLITLDDEDKAALAPYLVDFRFVLDDLTQQSDAQIHARSMTALAQVVALAFKRLTYARDPLAVMERLVPLVQEVITAPNGLTALAALLRYALQASDLDTQSLRELVSTRLGPVAEEAMMSTADKLIEQGVLKGRVEGRAEGEARGRTCTLLKLLQLKFGPQPDAVIARVTGASIEDLDRWAEQILDATSVEQVLR